MAKASISKKYSVSGSGILSIEDDKVAIEVEDTGELVFLNDLLKDFKDKDVKISCTYNEDY